MAEDEDSTDLKLAILASLTECNDSNLLLETLLSCGGNVDEASKILASSPPVAESRKRKTSTIGYQSSLSSFATQRASTSPKKKQLTKKGQTLHLYAPEDIAAHTPCSIIHNFLPKDQADDLLKELLAETESYGRVSFKLFEREVVSPHTFAFYVDDWDEAQRQKAEYIYDGKNITDVRTTLKEMKNVSTIVQTAVNEEIQKRIITHYPDQKKLKYQSPDEWVPNTSFVNCYDGGKESVGYHSDQLTYLGPRAIIGSLSLGVAREFRVRKIIPRQTKFDPKDEKARRADLERADTEGQISIHLPHNSLLVMHAEMQEEWKHSIAPAQAIDPHPIAKGKRLNITYRCYRKHLHPSKTPRCKCGIPAVLRCVQKQEQNRGRYIWQCHADQGSSSCNYLTWAEFDDDGLPPWGVSSDKTADKG